MLAVSAAHAGEDTIKIGILHSLSGTMAISESVLKNTVLMLIADQNKKGGLLGRKLEPIVVDPASDWDVFAEKARQLLSNDKGRCIRVLDLRLTQVRAADFRGIERLALLPCAVRR
jgi:urea transport system substrate-binding protein